MLFEIIPVFPPKPPKGKHGCPPPPPKKHDCPPPKPKKHHKHHCH
ncbi:hypothetical protein EV383_4569 [Pseudonocardia sediminis]|uniref:Uncharacterized protein n=1 Tax=Pseudonocardia sediminis TaxID=1397368 RepID=A0A4Q7V4H9_PSEST|nr:hypothetical protein [Pseudonocardia sediminis]RZT87643.1 hypothetical protein EV383_4569 [Pseudonocardia sediminis]